MTDGRKGTGESTVLLWLLAFTVILFAMGAARRGADQENNPFIQEERP